MNSTNTNPPGPGPAPVDFGTPAKAAVADLKALASTLPIDDAIPPHALAQAQVSNRVPLEILSIAAAVLGEDPSQFPQFDAVLAQEALDYVDAMTPVATAARLLAARLTRSILKRRSAAAIQALALYAVLKGTARMPANERMRSQAQAMGQILQTKRRSRATTVTKKEMNQAVKAARLQKKADAAQAAADKAVQRANAARALAAAQAGAGGAAGPVTPPDAPPSPAATAKSSALDLQWAKTDLNRQPTD